MDSRSCDREPSELAIRLASVFLWLAYAFGAPSCFAETTPRLVPVVNVAHPGCGDVRLIFSRDGKHLISTGANETCVWEVSTGRLRNRIEGWYGGYDPVSDLVYVTKFPSELTIVRFPVLRDKPPTVSAWTLLPSSKAVWTSIGDIVLFDPTSRCIVTSKIERMQASFIRNDQRFDTKTNPTDSLVSPGNLEVRNALTGVLLFAIDGLFQDFDVNSRTITTYSPSSNQITTWDFATGNRKSISAIDRNTFWDKAPKSQIDILPFAPINEEKKISAHLVGDSVAIRSLNDSRILSQFTATAQGSVSIHASNHPPLIIRGFGNACSMGEYDSLIAWSLLDRKQPFCIRPKWKRVVDGLPLNQTHLSGDVLGDFAITQADIEVEKDSNNETPFRRDAKITARILSDNGTPRFYYGLQTGLTSLDPTSGTSQGFFSTNANLPKEMVGTNRTFSSPNQSLVLHSYKNFNELLVSNAQATLSVFDATKLRHLGFITQKMDYGPVAVSSNSICCINNRDELCLYSKANLSRPIVLATSQNAQGCDFAFNLEGSILYGFPAKQADFRSPLAFTAWRVIDGAKIFEQPLPQAALPGRFTIDGDRLITQQGEIFDASKGKLLYKLKRPLWDQFALATGASRLIEASVDSGVTRISDLDTGVELASLYSFNRDVDWLVTTPDGYFDGSPGGIKLLSYRDTDTNELIPLERYRKQFEVPGLLPKVWKGEEFRKSKTQKMEAVPIVRITSPKQSDTKDGVVEMSSGKLTVQATAESRGSTPITELRLKIEGEPIDTPGRIVSFDESANSTVSGSWSLDLKPGKYEMSVVAHDANTYGISDSLTILNLGGGLIRQEKPDLYVLAIGIADYQNGIRKLDYADTDAQAVVKALRNYSSPLFNKIEIKELVDKQATKINILKNLNWLNRNATERDYVVVYYAGHGKLDRNMYYLLPVDADPEDLFSTAIDKETLKRGLLNLPGKVLVMFDSCHSGALGRSVESDRGFDGLLKDLNSDENGIAYLSATNSDEEAMENRQLEKGHFTAALIEGLSGQGTPEIPIARIGAGEITYTELERYITKRVKQLTNGRQHVGSHRLRTYHQDFPISLPPK